MTPKTIAALVKRIRNVSLDDGWQILKMPSAKGSQVGSRVVRTVAVHRVSASMAKDQGVNEVWARMPSEEVSVHGHTITPNHGGREFRGTAEAVAVKILATLSKQCWIHADCLDNIKLGRQCLRDSPNCGCRFDLKGSGDGVCGRPRGHGGDHT